MSEPLTTRLPATLCPGCGYVIDAASSLEEQHRPKVGDFSVCIGCAAVLRFDKELRLRCASAELVRRECARDPDLKRSLSETVAAVRMMLRELGPPPGRDTGPRN